MPGKITDIDIEKKFGKPTYVVEIQAESGEIDVIIDINTGEILGTEDWVQINSWYYVEISGIIDYKIFLKLFGAGQFYFIILAKN